MSNNKTKNGDEGYDDIDEGIDKAENGDSSSD